VVSVLVRWSGLAPDGSVTLSLPGWSDTQALAPGREFGEQRLEFNVPEFAAGTRASVSVKANGRDYRFAQTLSPARKWTVHIVPHEHLDVGYSDFQTKLAELHSRVINEALDLNRGHPEFRFTLDGYWQARHFLEGRSESQKQDFYRAVRDRKIYVPAQHSVILTGFPTGEALIRSFYGSRNLSREAGGPWDTANITDVPSYSWAYASILAASGLKYFAASANADRGPMLMLGDLHRRSPFYWEGPDGSRVLMWYSRHYHQISSQFGLPTQVANGYEGLASFLRVYERPDYAPRSVMLHGSQSENTSIVPEQAALARQWNATFAYPELRYSGFGEALEKIAAEAGGKLPVIRGDGGPFWEDGIASDAYHAALERETERRAVSAEKLGTVASLVDPRYRQSGEALGCLWENIALMGEHTWGWGRSVTEPHSEDSTRELAYKRFYANAARYCTEYLLDRAMTAIAGRVATPPRALVVFNTLNWPRRGWVEFDLQKTRELFDLEAKQVVAFDVLEDHTAYQRIRFRTGEMPPLGYRTYAVRDKAAPAAGAPAAVSTAVAAPATRPATNVVESPFYRVTLDPATGSVRGIYDKELKRELVDASAPYRFNQYVYVTGGDNPPAFTQLLTYRRHLPLARLEPHAAGEGRLVSVTKTAAGTSARLESRGVNTPRISTEIILFDDEKKIEFVNRVTKETVYKKEAAYFAFPVDVGSPEFRYEVQNGVVNPAKDMMPGAGLEWFSSQNWVSAGGQGVEVGLVGVDSFLWTFGDVVRGTWPTKFEPKDSTVFAYVMNNYWGTNYVAAQGGDFTFRYALTSAPRLDPAAMSRMGWEQTTRLESTLVKSQDRAAAPPDMLPAERMSFLQTSDPSVLLSTWKQAEDGEGSVLRFIELGGGRRRGVRVTSPLFGSASVRTCNAVEDCGEPAPAGDAAGGGFGFDAGPRQIQTFKLQASRR
jgi:hypothetical protein